MKTPCILFACALSARAFSAPGEPPARVTLAEALLLVRENNPDLAAARSDVATAEAVRDAAVRLPNPVLSYATTKIPTDGTPAGTVYGNDFYSRSYDTVVGAAQLVEVGGKRGSRRASADAGIAGAAARLADTARLLDSAVAKAYIAGAVAARAADLARASADAFARTASLAQEREAAGEISSAERAQVEIAEGRFRADAAQAALASSNAARALAALLNRPAVLLADDLDALVGQTAGGPPVPDDPSVLDRRPDVLAAGAALRRAEAELSLQKALRVPDPTLLVQYEREPPDQRNTIGFGVSLPIPLFNHNASGVRQAELARDAARRDLDRARVRGAQDLAATRETLDTAAARAARLADDLAPKAMTVRETVRYAYEQGGASLLELLEAERNANDLLVAAAAARGDLAAARADYLAARAAAPAKETP